MGFELIRLSWNPFVQSFIFPFFFVLNFWQAILIFVFRKSYFRHNVCTQSVKYPRLKVEGRTPRAKRVEVLHPFCPIKLRRGYLLIVIIASLVARPILPFGDKDRLNIPQFQKITRQSTSFIFRFSCFFCFVLIPVLCSSLSHLRPVVSLVFRFAPSPQSTFEFFFLSFASSYVDFIGCSELIVFFAAIEPTSFSADKEQDKNITTFRNWTWFFSANY